MHTIVTETPILILIKILIPILIIIKITISETVRTVTMRKNALSGVYL
jgi:hypothetical protein